MSLSLSDSYRTLGKEFLCKVRYQNPLPVVPFPPKLLPIPPTYVDPNAGSYSQARLQHYVEYKHTTLEEATPYPMHVDADLGMPIDPCTLGAFDEDKGAARPKPHKLDEKDEFLLSLPSSTNPAAAKSEVATPANGSGANTPSLQPSTTGAFAPQQGPRQHPSVGRASSSRKRKFDHSKEGQLQAIEESFEFFAKYDERQDGSEELLRDLRHPTNSKLKAVEAIPLLPDEKTWPNMYTVFSLDACPEPEYVAQKNGTTGAAEVEELGDEARESLVLRPRVRKNNLGEDEQWIECFLPEDEDTAKRIRTRLRNTAQPVNDDDEGVEYRFEKSREYDMPIRPDPHRQDLYMITLNAGADTQLVATYVPVKARVMLKRRRIPLAVRQQEEIDDPLRVTSLALQLREFSEDEIQERSEASNLLHEVIKEEIVRGSTARNDETDENIDIGDDLFASDADDRSRRRNRRRSPSLSPLSP
ncbi:hypothetical protein GGI12_002201 [Dipsacomyces acuminosporus]|nr:hypothetical protein GGI12_002201 [Dipsacomyces acuminosporus]